MDPKVTLDISREAFDAFRRDYLVASVVVLLLVNGAWAWAVRGLVRALSEVQNARVADHKEAEKRYESVANRMAVHMDKSTEATVALLSREQSKRRREPVPP